MARRSDGERSFGELQLAILQVLWEAGEAGVEDVREALAPERELATSTVATVLSRLEEQGVVSHTKDGRRYLYRSRLAREDVRRSEVGQLLRRLFGGDARALVSHLVREREIGRADLERLEDWVEEREG